MADLTNTNAHLTAENARLNDRMAKLVKDLTVENKQLLEENQRLNQTVKKVRLQQSFPAHGRALRSQFQEVLQRCHSVTFCTARKYFCACHFACNKRAANGITHGRFSFCLK